MRVAQHSVSSHQSGTVRLLQVTFCTKQETNEILRLFEQSENIQFVDETDGNSVSLHQIPDQTRSQDDLTTATFDHYLRRPVRIYTKTWNEGDYLKESFEPWALWAQQPQIKQKLNNFGLFRGNLKLKLMVNASPFFYGAGRLTYEPLIGYFRTDTAFAPSGVDYDLIGKSQQRGFEFYPQSSMGGEMTLPFFYPKTWLDLTSMSDFQTMGKCNLFSYTPLSNANSVTTASVTLTVVAWCEEVQVSAPTFSLAVQSEYSKLGPVSGPSSAIAEAARSLKKIPVLKPYAMGTEVIASGVGSIAKYFGFTNVPTTSAQHTFKPGSHYGMCTTEISTPYEKLSLDDKNELSIDPRISGLPPKDEMLISEIIERESFLFSSTWSAIDVTNKKLFNSYITPTLYSYTSQTTPNVITYYQTPLSHISRLFTSWRGSMIFRFQVVCTPFHKGRIRITWDPRFNLSSATDTQLDQTLTTSMTKIIDIGETQEVEMEIPYMQALAFMSNYGTDASNPTSLFGTGALPVISNWNSYFNGTLCISVLNPQTSPVTSSDIQILTFVRAGSDFKFANPRNLPTNFTFLRPQAEEIIVDSSTDKQYLTFTQENETPEIFKVHMGESVKSLRQLIHRQTFYNCFVCKKGQDTVSAGTYNKWIFPFYPQAPGYQNSNRNNFAYAKGIVSNTTTFPVCYSAPSVFNMIAPLYIGARGSIVYNANVDGIKESKLVSMARSVSTDWNDKSLTTKQGWFNPASWNIDVNPALGAPSKYRSLTYSNGASGRVLTNQTTQAGLMAHFPYYSPLRFTSSTGFQTSANIATALSIPPEEKELGIELVVSTKNFSTDTSNDAKSTIVDLYVMAGHDFSFLYYNCVPTFYYYQTEYGETA